MTTTITMTTLTLGQNLHRLRVPLLQRCRIPLNLLEVWVEKARVVKAGAKRAANTMTTTITRSNPHVLQRSTRNLQRIFHPLLLNLRRHLSIHQHQIHQFFHPTLPRRLHLPRPGLPSQPKHPFGQCRDPLHQHLRLQYPPRLRHQYQEDHKRIRLRVRRSQVRMKVHGLTYAVSFLSLQVPTHSLTALVHFVYTQLAPEAPCA